MNPRSFLVSVVLGLALCAAASPAPPQKDNSAPSIGGITHGLHIIQRDPQRPGKLLFELWAASASGQALGSGQTGTLTKIKAVLYEKGIKSAVMTAPQGEADSIKKMIVASGHVLVRSLTQPGTSLTADRVNWYAAGNQYGANPIVVASGNVILKTQGGWETYAPVMYGDTVLKKISTNRPGRATLRKGGKS